MLSAGCATGTPATSDTPRRDLAGRPVALAPTAAPATTGASTRAAAPTTRAAATSAPSPVAPRATAGEASGPARATAPSYRVVGAVDDAAGDQGLDGPSYGDLVRVGVADGGRTARVTVVVHGPLPARTRDRESLGIGVDLFATATQTESDYQLFADGEPDGWFAYLDTPGGFVRYPGTFAVGADRVVFTVPWSALGGRSHGWFSGFADWTQGGTTGTLGGNASSSDRAPAVGSTAYSR